MSSQYIRKIILKEFDDDTYISSLPIINHLRNLKELTFECAVTFFVGENGTGKSTLTEAIAICAGLNAEGGSKNFNFSTRQTASDLYKYIKLVRKNKEKDGFFLRAETFYNIASEIDDLGLQLDIYGGKSLHAQSHGESFMTLVQNRFLGNGLYILDEPEAALSPLRQYALLREIYRLVETNSQLIIATHSPIILGFPNSKIYQITVDGIKVVEYKDSQHYLFTKQFLNDPERYLRYLMEEDT